MEPTSHKLTILTILKPFIPTEQNLLCSVNENSRPHTKRLSTRLRMGGITTIEYPFPLLGM